MERPFRDIPDEELERDINRLEREREALRSQPLRFRSDAHAAADRSAAEARAELRRRLEASVYTLSRSGGVPVYPPIGDLAALLDPDVVTEWHAAIDRAGGDIFRDIDRPEYERQRAELAVGAEARGRELNIRRAERAAEAARAALDELNGVTSDA